MGIETATPAAPAAGMRTARVITEVCAPWVLVTVTPFLVVPAGDRWLPRAGWALVIALCCAGGPMGAILIGARLGRVTSGHHVRERAERIVPLLLGLVVVVAGVVALWVGQAPRDLAALVWALLGELLVAVAITVVWKVSLHVAAAASCVAVLAQLYGPWPLVGVVVVLAVAWSRVRLTDHTVAQVIGGAVLGAVVGGGLFAALS
jgi:membrane-associated phospholipid phosphatase